MVSVTHRPRFYPRENIPGTHWIGGWVGLSAGLDTEARGKILCLCQVSNPCCTVFSQDTILTELAQLLNKTKRAQDYFYLTPMSKAKLP
jgi:hypothetical protein